jgi:hypothetical protein
VKRDEAQLAGLTSLEQRRLGAVRIEDPVRVVESNHFVMLNQIDAIGL